MRETECSHFWLGCFPCEQRVVGYFAEVYDEDREHTPLSQFAHDQSETWYDHDFMEHGFNLHSRSIEELVNGHSYFKEWTAELVRRAAEIGLNDMNMIVFISQDQIDNPCSVEGDDYALHYLGTIEYPI